MALAFSLIAVLAYAFLAIAVWVSPRASVSQGWGLAVAWVAHALALLFGLYVQGEWHFGFAPALSMTAWLVLSVYLLERHVFPAIPSRWTLFALAGLGVAAAATYPGKPLGDDQPMVVLALHWVLGVASYGMFAAALTHAWLMRDAEEKLRNASDQGSGMPLLGLERLMFLFIRLGFVLLTAALLVGIWMGAQVWKWDHKSVFSVLAWGVFAVLLVGREWAGWRGQRAYRMVAVGSIFLLLAYVGSRFVLEVVLHR